MARARRHIRHDQIEAGYFRYLLTGVQYGHAGIANLIHQIPFAQGEWAKVDDSGESSLELIEDAPTSRVPTKLDVVTTGTHRILKRFQIPADFGSFPDPALGLMARRSGALTTLQLSLLKGGTADSVLDGVDISPMVDSTFEFFELTPGDTYDQGDFVTLQIEYVSSTIGVFVEIADIEFLYKSGLGNV